MAASTGSRRGAQLRAVVPHTGRGARGLILPAASQIGSPNESELLPQTAAELNRLALLGRRARSLGNAFASRETM